MANQKDDEALEKLIQSGRCAYLDPSTPRFIDQESDDHLTARVRPRGGISTLWVPIESAKATGSE